METIISACISAGVTLLICMIQQNKTVALVVYRLNELEKRMEKNNSVIERTYKLEKESALQKEQIENLSKDIAEMKKGV